MSDKRDNTGTLSRNEDKNEPGANANWPDYKGQARVAGVDYWLSAWLKVGDRGKFLSVALKPKDEAKRPAPAAAASAADDDFTF